MPRAFLIVLDSVGIGGAPDAGRFFNGDVPDTGANTVAHIAQACVGLPRGPLRLPNLTRLGLGRAVALASNDDAPGLNPDGPVTGMWGAATEHSPGKDTPTGHWELAGVPLPWNWHYFPDNAPAFPTDLSKAVARAAGTGGILGNCHASGTAIIEDLGEEHIKTGWPICYTSVDSVFQIAAHEEHFGLERLLNLCADIAPMLHDMRVGRVIARPFLGEATDTFKRTANRRDFALPPPDKTLCDWISDAGGTVHGIGKIGDIFSMRGIDSSIKGFDAALIQHLEDAVEQAADYSLTFANFVEFDSEYGHQRDVEGYAAALEGFDRHLGQILPRLRPGDMMIITADHGNDPTWTGKDHTRERVPVLVSGKGAGKIGLVQFADVAASVAHHLGVAPRGPGQSFLPD